MANQTLSVIEALWYFLDYDTSARWKTVMFTIAIGGSSGAVDLALLDKPVTIAIQDMVILAVITLILCISWYCCFAHRKLDLTEIPIFDRRDLLQTAAAGLATLVVTSLSRVQARSLEYQVSAASGDIADPNKIKAANRALATANSAGLHLQSSVKYGKQALSNPGIELAKDRWEATLLALQQRTFEVEEFVPPLSEPQDSDFVAPFTTPQPVAGRMTWHGKWVSPQSSDRAKLYKLSLGEPKYEGGVPQYLKISGAISVLDGYSLQNVVYVDSRIVYHGGITAINRVYFVRCTFDLSFNDNCKAFAKSVLDNIPVSFYPRE